MLLKISLYGILSLLISASTALNQELKVDLAIRTIDYDSDESIVAGTVKVTVIPPSENASLQNDHFRFLKNFDQQADIEKILIDIAVHNFPQRSIKLRRRSREEEAITREIKAYLVPKGKDVSYPILLKEQRKYLEDGSNVEKALALFKYAHTEMINPRGEYGVMIRYNYASSLLETCKEGYDTCETARELCQELANEYDDNKANFKGIDKGKLNLCIKVVDDIDKFKRDRSLIISWNAVRQQYNEGGIGLKNAAIQTEQILNKYQDNAKSWSGNGRPRREMLKDAGVSYHLYSDYLINNPDSPDAPDLKNFLDTSIKYLTKAIELGDNSSKTLENLELARSKRASIP